jgi:hypothetical protein
MGESDREKLHWAKEAGVALTLKENICRKVEKRCKKVAQD